MKDGQYVITVDGKSQNLQEELSKISNKEELDKLIGKIEPKTMEEIAKEQLSYQASMKASLEKISNRTSIAFATSKLGEDIGNAFKGGYEGITDIMTDRGALSPESIRTGFIDKNADQLGNMFDKLM